jgi:hypothetical protein
MKNLLTVLVGNAKERYHIRVAVITGDNIQVDLKEVVYGVYTRLYQLNMVLWWILMKKIMEVLFLHEVSNFLTI